TAAARGAGSAAPGGARGARQSRAVLRVAGAIRGRGRERGAARGAGVVAGAQLRARRRRGDPRVRECDRARAGAAAAAGGRGGVVITGGPGVGKTTIVKAIVHLARIGHRRVALAAPTGRAAKRLSEATAAEAMTIHRLLEFQPHEGGFQRNGEHPLEADVLVVD